jgi:FkbM family methyltransferase
MGDEMIDTIFAKCKKIIRKVLPTKVILFVNYRHIRAKAKKFGLLVENDGVHYLIKRQNDEIRISSRHAIYIYDIIENFDFYFSAVKPIKWRNMNIVDFSTPRWHWVTDFDYFPVIFPSFVEPIITTKQYLEFADLKSNAVVIDLGAYSGLTSILFDRAIPSGGRVIALEADRNNVIACAENFILYEKFSKRKIELIESAIWKNDKGVNFSSEGNMGSSVVDIVGRDRGDNSVVPSLTLSQLAEKLKLERVDFIKCDIEGGETEIFDSPEFFSKFLPKILIECHMIDRESTTSTKCLEVLLKYGYTCEIVEQQGYPLPLLMCKPPIRNNE